MNSNDFTKYLYTSGLFKTLEQQESLSPESSQYRDNMNYLMSQILKLVSPELIRLKAYWIRRYYLDEADCDSIIYDGVLKTLQYYKPSHKGSCKFYSFLCSIINQQLNNFLTKIRRKKRDTRNNMSLDYLLSRNKVAKDIVNGVKPDRISAGVLYKKDKMSLVEDRASAVSELGLLLSKASPLQKRIIKLLKNGNNQNEISRELKIKPHVVSKNIREMKKILLNQ